MRPTLVAFALASLLALPALADQGKYTPTPKELLAQSTTREWRTPDPANLLDMSLPQGHVLIELAPDFTPLHAANIRTLVREYYFDGLAIVRVQDNFVTQWDDPASDDNDTAHTRPLGTAKKTLPPEYTRPIDPKLSGRHCPTATCMRRRWASPRVFRPRVIRPAVASGWRIATAWSAWRATSARTPATAARCTR